MLFFSFDKSAKCIRQIFEHVLHFQTGFVIHLFELFQASELPYKLCILYFLFFMQNKILAKHFHFSKMFSLHFHCLIILGEILKFSGNHPKFQRFAYP